MESMGVCRELPGCIHERGVIQVRKSQIPARIQRLLTLVNIRLQHLISDIEGAGGETNPEKIA
jgi:hypothetical protein